MLEQPKQGCAEDREVPVVGEGDEDEDGEEQGKQQQAAARPLRQRGYASCHALPSVIL
jgi:hypothetical protein